MSQRLRLKVPAKINLHLRVGPPTADGFHPLLSWMCTVGLFDILTLEAAQRDLSPQGDAQPGRTPSRNGSIGRDAPGSAGVLAPAVPPGVPLMVRITCDDPTLATDGSNLIIRAAAALADAMRSSNRSAGEGCTADVLAVLQKRIPTGAGLGGGSADGARMLLGLNRLWSAGFDAGGLAAISAKLGSDLPFFCHGPSSICTGRGEFVRPIARPAPRWVLLILPAVHMPTPAVYRKFDEMKLGDAADIETQPDWLAWSQFSAEQLLPRLVNDLESPAFALRPDLAAMRRAAEEIVCRSVRMSGSGSSLFTLYDTELEARAAAGDFSVKFSGHSGNKGLGAASFAIRTEVVELAPEFADDLNTASPAA